MSRDNLTLFLYILMRDHLPAGRVAEIIDQHVHKASGKAKEYTAIQLAAYAEQLGREILSGKADDLFRPERQRDESSPSFWAWFSVWWKGRYPHSPIMVSPQYQGFEDGYTASYNNATDSEIALFSAVCAAAWNAWTDRGARGWKHIGYHITRNGQHCYMQGCGGNH